MGGAVTGPEKLDAMAEMVGEMVEGERMIRVRPELVTGTLLLGEYGADVGEYGARLPTFNVADVAERALMRARDSPGGNLVLVLVFIVSAVPFVVGGVNEPCILRTVPAWIELRLGDAPRECLELSPVEEFDVCRLCDVGALALSPSSIQNIIVSTLQRGKGHFTQQLKEAVRSGQNYSLATAPVCTYSVRFAL